MRCKPIKVGKKRFYSIQSASRFYKKNYQTFVSRLRSNWTVISAAQTPVRKYERRV